MEDEQRILHNIYTEILSFCDRYFLETVARSVSREFSNIVENKFNEAPYFKISDLYINLNKRIIYFSNPRNILDSTALWHSNGRTFLKITFDRFRAQWIDNTSGVPRYLRAERVCIMRDASASEVQPSKTAEIIFHRLGRIWSLMPTASMLWYCDEDSLRPLFAYVSLHDCANLTIRIFTFHAYDLPREIKCASDARTIADWLHREKDMRRRNSFLNIEETPRQLCISHANPRIIEPLVMEITQKFLSDISRQRFYLKVEFKPINEVATPKPNHRELRNERTAEQLQLEHEPNVFQALRQPLFVVIQSPSALSCVDQLQPASSIDNSLMMSMAQRDFYNDGKDNIKIVQKRNMPNVVGSGQRPYGSRPRGAPVVTPRPLPSTTRRGSANTLKQITRPITKPSSSFATCHRASGLGSSSLAGSSRLPAHRASPSSVGSYRSVSYASTGSSDSGTQLSSEIHLNFETPTVRRRLNLPPSSMYSKPAAPQSKRSMAPQPTYNQNYYAADDFCMDEEEETVKPQVYAEFMPDDDGYADKEPIRPTTRRKRGYQYDN